MLVMMNGFEGGFLWWPLMAGLGALALVFAVIVFVFWIWMLIDCIQRNFRNKGEKIIWVVVIIFTGWIGALVYLIAVRNMNPNGFASGSASSTKKRK